MMEWRELLSLRNTSACVDQLVTLQGSHEAINTLGWHALTMEGNMSKAAGLFEASYRLGNKEAAHSLGHMYMDGRMPGRTPDRVTSYKPPL